MNHVKKRSIKNHILRPSLLRKPQVQWAGKKCLLSVENSSECKQNVEVSFIMWSICTFPFDKI